MNTINVDKNKFDRDGYVLLKGVFSPDEIAKLRETVYKQYEIDKKKKLTFELYSCGIKEMICIEF